MSKEQENIIDNLNASVERLEGTIEEMEALIKVQREVINLNSRYNLIIENLAYCLRKHTS